MTLSKWTRVEAKGAPEWLQFQEQKKKTAYRVRYEKLGLSIRTILRGDFTTWKDAARAGEKLIQQERELKANPSKRVSLVKCSDIAEELIAEKAAMGRRKATLEQMELFYRKHIIPFLEGNEQLGTQGSCPEAARLTADVWTAYKLKFRANRPGSPLFNHWKYFGMLYRRAHMKGLIPLIKLHYSEKEDDQREPGRIIQDDDFEEMLRVAPSVSFKWYVRLLLQRFTGRRPGEIRSLRKKPLPGKPANIYHEGDGLTIRLFKEDTKNKRSCEFRVRVPVVVKAVLEMWWRYPNSPYLFPNEINNDAHMDKHLNGWYSILEKAGVEPIYTPHDIRHTYLSEMFKRSNQWAVICYQAGLTLEEAEKTYIHLDADDTLELAEVAVRRATEMGVIDYVRN